MTNKEQHVIYYNFNLTHLNTVFYFRVKVFSDFSISGFDCMNLNDEKSVVNFPHNFHVSILMLVRITNTV